MKKLSIFDCKFLAACHISVGRQHWSDELFLHACGVAPIRYRTSDGTQRLLDQFNIPQTRENYLNLAFAGNPPEEPLDGEIEEMLPEEFRMWDADDICDAPSAGWCGEPSHTPVDPDEDDEED